nr:amidohydrolase family protein [Oscillochloris sp. ZM17-4]
MARTIPGCQRLDEVGENEYETTLKIGLQAVRGVYNGRVKIDNIITPESYEIHVDGKGSNGFLKGSGGIKLRVEGDTTILDLAEVAGAPLYVVHVTNAAAMDAIRQSRERGYAGQIFGETCTQYFFFTKEDLAREGFEGAKWVCSPPFREASDHPALWGAVASNALQVISTDHCPFWFAGGVDGRPAGKELGRESFAKIPNGCPGIEERMMVLYTHGVRAGRISLNRWVELTSTNPAKLFGCYPQKGLVAPGADADLVIWDPEAKHTIRAATNHQATDYSLYEGWEVTGAPRTVLSRGRVLVDAGAWRGEAGAGQFVHRRQFGL